MAFDFERNTSTLSEFIGYADLMDFREISPEHFRDNDMKVYREIWIFNIFFPWRPFAQHVSHIFSYSNFRRGHLDNQSEYEKSPTNFC